MSQSPRDLTGLLEKPESGIEIDFQISLPVTIDSVDFPMRRTRKPDSRDDRSRLNCLVSFVFPEHLQIVWQRLLSMACRLGISTGGWPIERCGLVDGFVRNGRFFKGRYHKWDYQPKRQKPRRSTGGKSNSYFCGL